MNRDLDDLFSWQKQKQKRKEDKLRLKEELERNEMKILNSQGKKFMSKESKKYIKNKENFYDQQKVEERLLMMGK